MGGGHHFPPALTCDYNWRAPDKFRMSLKVFFFSCLVYYHACGKFSDQGSNKRVKLMKNSRVFFEKISKLNWHLTSHSISPAVCIDGNRDTGCSFRLGRGGVIWKDSSLRTFLGLRHWLAMWGWMRMYRPEQQALCEAETAKGAGVVHWDGALASE